MEKTSIKSKKIEQAIIEAQGRARERNSQEHETRRFYIGKKQIPAARDNIKRRKHKHIERN